jgi:hypothetical protein
MLKCSNVKRKIIILWSAGPEVVSHVLRADLLIRARSEVLGFPMIGPGAPAEMSL